MRSVSQDALLCKFQGLFEAHTRSKGHGDPGAGKGTRILVISLLNDTLQCATYCIKYVMYNRPPIFSPIQAKACPKRSLIANQNMGLIITTLYQLPWPEARGFTCGTWRAKSTTTFLALIRVIIQFHLLLN